MNQQVVSGRQPRPPVERRAQPRLRVQMPALSGNGRAWRVHDISRAGVCLMTEEPLSEGSEINLELVDTASGRRCGFDAMVVWSAASRAGLRFNPLSEEQESWLASRFAEWLAAGAEPAE